MMQAQSEEQILQLVQQIGPSPGAKKMMIWEFTHAKQAIEKGLYVTYISDGAKEDCARVGSFSRCFCGCSFKDHLCEITKKGQKTGCTKCECKEFKFIPRRPEEVGQWWMPRRKGFDVNTWRPSCVCKKTHEEHAPNRPFKCKSGGCPGFQSDFVCLSCDKKWEDHYTLYETEKERQMAGKTIREDFIPLATNPQVQAETMKKLGIDGRTADEKAMDEIRAEFEKKDQPQMMRLQMSSGVNGGPEVNLMIDTSKNYQPKQDLSKPEKSIRIMQQKGIAGQRPPAQQAIQQNRQQYFQEVGQRTIQGNQQQMSIQNNDMSQMPFQQNSMPFPPPK